MLGRARAASRAACGTYVKSSFCTQAAYLKPAPHITDKTLRLAERLVAGNRTALSRSITLIESTRPQDKEQAEALLDHVLSLRRKAAGSKTEAISSPGGVSSFRLGIAGPPGAGKSTFVEAFGEYLTSLGHRVAVVAIDPSSSISGGSILGDKTRMADLSRNPNAFVRPSPTRGTLGGVAEHTNEVVLLCEAGGYDLVIVETVGLGQSEIAVCDTTDMLMLLVPPAAGDELQGVKKGIMEVADMVVVNKADGATKNLAQHAATEYMHSLQLQRRRVDVWKPTVKMCSALHKKNIDGVWEEIKRFQKSMGMDVEVVLTSAQKSRLKRHGGNGRAEVDGAGGQANLIAKRRGKQSQGWMWNQLQHQLATRTRADPELQELVEAMDDGLTRGYVSPRKAATVLLNRFLGTEDQAADSGSAPQK